jgi:hypothetical protein
MKPYQAVAFTLLFPSALLLQAKDKKPNVPAVLGQARSIYVEAVDGKEFDQNLDADDKIAIANVRDELGKWKHYALVTSRSDADIVILVRKGRAEGGNAAWAPQTAQKPIGAGQPGAGGTISPGQLSTGGPVGAGAGMGSDIGVGADAESNEDLFEVCAVNASGKLSAPLWHRSMPNGLNTPKVMLLVQFEEAVDKAYPPQPAAQTQQSQGTQTQTQPAQKP